MRGCVDADDEARTADVVLNSTTGRCDGDRGSSEGLEMGEEKPGSWQTKRLTHVVTVEKGRLGNMDGTERWTNSMNLSVSERNEA